MNKSEMHVLGHALLRVLIGLMFVFAGYGKLMNTDGVVGMLTGIGFPMATFFAWVLLLSELIFGLLVLVGFKVKYTVWPLAFILLVAEILVVAPGQGITSTSSFLHLIAIAGLITIAFYGPGKWAMSKS